MNLTRLVRPYFMPRVRAARSWTGNVEAVQRGELAWLLERGRPTLWGRSHGYGRVRTYEEYRDAVPVCGYDAVRPWVMRMVAGESDVLWPGRTRRFAQSSGTSDGKSKYIPVTADSLTRCHYQGGRDVVAHYLDLYPDSRMFSGKGFILGGSFANELQLADRRVRVGDLSANLIEAINPLVNMVRVPGKQVALMADWKQKLPALVAASLHADVTNISGVPSWFLTVLREVVKAAGASTIHDVWPNLEVFFHGGIAFGPYREQYDAITDRTKMRYLESYNASEGFFAVQTAVDDHSMLLLLDGGVFYEFIPVSDIEAEHPRAIPAWEVEQGRIYALVITACNGLWRYVIGDTVKIESLTPLKISIAGRTKHYINAFGEELMVYNADAAIERTCRELGIEVANYTAAPVYTAAHSHGRHEWLIEFVGSGVDTEGFASRLDANLQQENSDYQAKRSGDLFLDRLSVVEARKGLFDDWLASTGKLGGQRKVPRLCNDRRFMDAMLRMNVAVD